jgi:hypothetical protein
MAEEKVTVFGYIQEILTGYAIEPVPKETIDKFRDSALKHGRTLVKRTGVPIEKAQKHSATNRIPKKSFPPKRPFSWQKPRNS